MLEEKVSIFDKMLNSLRINIANIKDERKSRSDIKYKFTDIILSAFSIFYFQNKSWLSFQNSMKSLKGNSNATTIFKIEDIPSDNHIRNILDKIKPQSFKKVYDDTIMIIEQIGILKQFIFMKEYLIIALDATCYHSSKKIHCDHCQTKTDSKTGEVSYFHNAITPTIVHPKLKKAIALFQEFISNEDGQEKQDCEVNASKRWLDSFNLLKLLRKKYKLIILGDDLYSRVPMINKIIEKGYSYILVCKETSHSFLYEQIEMIKNSGHCNTYKSFKIHNGKKQFFTYSWENELAINNSKDSIDINWCELIITNLDGKKLHCFSFVTDIKITKDNIEDIILAGRTRWKIENENNNTLKTKGYHLDHNFGHGKKYLSQNLCSLNILAFLFHTIQEFNDEQYIELRSILNTREEFFQYLNMLTTLFNFKSFSKMIEWTILSRQTKENVDMEPYVI